MKIVINKEEFEYYVVDIFNEMGSNQILFDYFFGGVIEVEVDVICDGEDVYIIGIMQYIELVGIYLGDLYVVLLFYNFGDFVLQ